MHSRSIYTEYIDFNKLAQDCPSFSRYVNEETSRIDFKDWDAVRELAKSLLKRDFGLDAELPEDRLCPMVPNRLNYVLWIQDLLDSTGDDLTDSYQPSRPVVGLDIGTGASVIYPLLGCAQRESWQFVGTDVDDKSLQIAKANVERNVPKLGDRIRIYGSPINGPLLPLDQLRIERLDFSMCNPPFYESVESLLSSAKQKSLPPSSACTGTPIEMVYVPTGEVGFARRILAESLVLRERVGWYTTMFGKLSSVSALVSDLKSLPDLAENWAVTEFVQGKTKRWGVGWSFRDRRPSEAASRCGALALHGSLPFPTEFVVDVEGMGDVDKVAGNVVAVMDGLQTLRWEWIEAERLGVAEMAGNVWSRAARRAKARGEVEMVDAEVRLGVTVKVRPAEVIVRWKRGRDRVLFESFCGMLKRKLQQG